MLLLYPASFPFILFLSSIYIPLCFYFIVDRSAANIAVLHIYIPLCFYFISCQIRDLSYADTIYIPLCFYFICVLLCLCEFRFRIYIPLCFYFIDVGCIDNDLLMLYLHSTMLLLYLMI